MNITLKPALAKFVKQQVKEGRYESADHVMSAAVSRLMQDEVFDFDFAPGELQAMVEEGEKDIAQGKVYTVEEVRKHFGLLNAKSKRGVRSRKKR